MAQLPGIKAGDVDITLADRMLNITGKREEDKEIEEDDFYRRERMWRFREDRTAAFRPAESAFHQWS